ncbi:hypothetical protein [Kribbella sp. NPDC051770]|uniref:hypothetical protein n=1 Tax=Kribbella sp. NPDC051770 TaxID=3155413 RepID=UPI003426A98C
MSDYLRDVFDAFRCWVDSLDQGSAGAVAAELVVQDPGHERPGLGLRLRELVGEELAYVVRADASARVGGAPVARDGRPDAGEELRHAAARLDQLTSVSAFASGGIDRGWPADAAAALQEASRVSASLARVVAYATEPVLANLEGGVVVGPEGQRGAAESAAALLGEAAVLLDELSRQVAKLTIASGAGQADGPTLDTEIVLQWRMPGMANESRFHVRVFRPSGRPPVVVIGELSDNRSQSITNSVGEVAAVVAEYVLGGAACDAYEWVQIEGQIQRVRFDVPYGRPRWLPQTHSELEQLAGGPVRDWHASGYTVAAMAERGITVLRPHQHKVAERRRS